MNHLACFFEKIIKSNTTKGLTFLDNPLSLLKCEKEILKISDRRVIYFPPRLSTEHYVLKHRICIFENNCLLTVIYYDSLMFLLFCALILHYNYE